MTSFFKQRKAWTLVTYFLLSASAEATNHLSIDCIFSDINDLPLGFSDGWKYEKYRDWRFLSIRKNKTEFQNDSHKSKSASNSFKWQQMPERKGHPKCLAGNMSETLCIYEAPLSLVETKGRYTSNLIAYGRPDHIAVFEGLCSINMP